MKQMVAEALALIGALAIITIIIWEVLTAISELPMP